ncbi:uncharacterized protein LOC131853339 [Achroia grisella]|uniref:uncharacterized protein LOC131853339 n=1 Tax=Achroia grisella TaxID=688607 RepID=UPI0027D20C1D|nr:uncharacterized protein LOC131853339 [Achroia grisella]
MNKEFQDAQEGTQYGAEERGERSSIVTADENIDGREFSRASRDGAEVYKVSVRVPPFWPEEPEIWFAQVEGQFSISGITNDATKFNYVISQLDNKYSREVKDIIISPPATQKYDKLKAELIKRLTASNENKLKQLLMHEELGDRKPSQFLRHLKGLAGIDVPDDFLKTIWISRLPHGVQTVLAGQPATTHVDDLADLADRVNDLTVVSPRVASINQASSNTELSDLRREVAELRRQMQSLTTNRGIQQQHQQRPSRRTTRSRSRSKSRSQSNYRKFPICWYHSKFGDKASHCIHPCDFKMAGNSMGSR